ncbi:DUF1127 domain-containing protein [Sinorhizobium fredii]|uniref:DUF1127 domain-containing protein n=1 Tax=Rhizobium fredii TaxID=380 RepID=UPI0005B326B0|nr:hypothetical protein [Sinorhizobium fredii]
MSNILSGMSGFSRNVGLDLNQNPSRGEGRIDSWRNPIRLLMVWDERLRFRAQLAQMAEHAPEVGLSQAQVDAEISKPFWRG